jgi:alkanesulfonate monooxygenase SsuD/methylene tetrahydromethanopterin reductase-like flavin-dependent oxidoreductase (luciferase family)
MWRVPDDGSMRYGIVLTTGDPRAAADLAARAEDAGWDGVFTFDAIAIGEEPMFDPWVTLAAVAMRTERVVLGAMVFAPARRRPWKLAREAASLDVLSGGRLVLPVGLGALDDGAFGNVGEPVEARVRAALVDETLAILDGLWSGEPFGFEGSHYRFGPMTFRPTPVQRPRIPIWVVGAWPHARSMRRAARWDGIVVQVGDGDGTDPMPDVLGDVTAWLHVARATAATGPGPAAPWPFEIVVEGVTPAGEPAAAGEIAAAHARAGATWWIEANWADRSPGSLLDRIAAGPPRAG